MGYADLYQTANILTPKQRLVSYARYYRSLEIEGLHYVHFVPAINTIAICLPNHTTHHEATAFLMTRLYSSKEINTVRNEASIIKKLVDFLWLWKLDLNEVDLLVLLEAFAEYLRLIPKDIKPRYSLEWATLKRVPLNSAAQSDGTLSILEPDVKGIIQISNWNGYKDYYIQKSILTAIQYLVFLKRRTVKYQNLELSQIPIKKRQFRSVLSGVLGPQTAYSFDIKAITREVNIKVQNRRIKSLSLNAIFSPEDLGHFMGAITSHQDRLLFTILQCLGLRASEAAGLKIEDNIEYETLFFMDYNEAKAVLKAQLRGDIQYTKVKNKGMWTCTVRDRGNRDFRSRHKKRGENRQIPWIFSEDTLLDLLYWALRERYNLMCNIQDSHGFLFVSQDHKQKGCPITGKTIGKKYEFISNRLLKSSGINLRCYSPHTFRHFYATYLLKILEISIDDVSTWLGHSSTEITRIFYSHWIPKKITNNNIENMILTLKQSITEKKQ